MTKTILRREFKFAPITTDSPAMSFDGYGAVFDNVDYYDDVIAPGAFAKTIADYRASGRYPAMQWNHDLFAMPIGIWTDMEEDETGLKVSGHFLDTLAGRDAYTIAKAGAVSGLSIGYYATAFEIQKREGKTVRLITEVDLIEISLVTFPANDLARINDVKSKEHEVKMNRKSLGRLAQLFAEAEQLVAKLAEVDDEDNEEEVASQEQDAEAKYDQTAVEAVKSISFNF